MMWGTENLSRDQLDALLQHARRAGDSELEEMVEVEIQRRLYVAGKTAGASWRSVFDRLSQFFSGFNDGAAQERDDA